LRPLKAVRDRTDIRGGRGKTVFGDAVPGYYDLWRVFQAFGDLPFK